MLNVELANNLPFNKPSSVWSDCLKAIKDNVTLMTFNTWFLPIKPLELKESTLKVQLPSQFGVTVSKQ